MEHFNGVSSVPGTTGANRNSLHDALGNMTGSLLPMQQQQQQNNGKGQEQAGVLYDLSSFDPLQAHAFQLTASAGLANLLTPSPAPNSAPQQNSNHQQLMQQPQHAQMQQQQHTQPQAMQQPQQAQGQQQQQNPFYFLQAHNTTAKPLQPIAPAAPGSTPQGMVGQAPVPMPANGVGQPQNFLLPGAAQGNHMTVAANFSNMLFPNSLQTAGAPAMIPNLMMTQHFQNLAANVQQQQQQQQHMIAPQQPSKKREAEDNSSWNQSNKKAIDPSVVSSATLSLESRAHIRNSKSNMSMDFDDVLPPDMNVDTSNMTPAERRRHERNLREQQRSYRISQQIKELREVLTESNVPFKPNKYSILLSVVDYIKQLQSRAIMLDAEHQKLITTIRQTNELVSSGATPCSGAEETDATNTAIGSDSGSDNEMLFVQGLDYRSLFEQCPAALGIAALDGRILECNSEFNMLLRFKRDDLLKQSLFNLVRNHQDIFRAMAQMLKCAEEPLSIGDTSAQAKNRHWSGPIVSKRDKQVCTKRNILWPHCVARCYAHLFFLSLFQLSINITLTVAEDGSPKFFSCALTTL
jgi:PAS domain-containing protein